MSDDPTSPTNSQLPERTTGPDSAPGAPALGLSGDQLGNTPKETPQERANTATIQSVAAIVAGIGLIGLGIWLASGSCAIAYYGAVLVGIASIIEGLYCGIGGTEYNDVPPRVHIVSFICGLVGAIVFVVVAAGVVRSLFTSTLARGPQARHREERSSAEVRRDNGIYLHLLLNDIENDLGLSQKDLDSLYQRCYKEFDDILSSPKGADVNMVPRTRWACFQKPLLHRMVKGGYGCDRRFPFDLIEKVIRSGADVNLVFDERTPLDAAIARKNTCRDEVVELLLRKGGRPNVLDEADFCPLHFAVVFGHPAVVKMLLEHGADVNYVRPLAKAGLGTKEEGRTALYYAVIGGAKAGLGTKEEGRTALHYAVIGGKMEIVQILVKHGADKTAKDANGKTPRDLALELDQVHLLKLL